MRPFLCTLSPDPRVQGELARFRFSLVQRQANIRRRALTLLDRVFPWRMENGRWIFRPSSNFPLTVLIADDHGVVREGLRAMLEREGMQVVGEAATGREAVELTQTLSPDVVLLDIRMPDGDGLWALETIKARQPEVCVIMLTTYANPGYLARAVTAGAAGYLTKETDPDRIVAAIRAAVAGDELLDYELLRIALRDVAAQTPVELEPEEPVIEPLAEQEVAVLRLIAAGLSNEAIGETLSISINTVKTHVRHIFQGGRLLQPRGFVGEKSGFYRFCQTRVRGGGKVNNDKAIQVQGLHKNFGDVHAVQDVSFGVQAAVTRLLGAVETARLSADAYEARQPFEDEAARRAYLEEALALASAAWEHPPLTVAVEQGGTPADVGEDLASAPPNAYAQSSPGMLVQFAIFGLNTSAMVLMSERKSRTLQRLLTTPITRLEIIAGHVLAMFVVVLLQQALLVAFGQLALGVAYMREPVGTLLVMVTLALWTASLGLLIGAVARSEEQVVMWALIAMFVLSAMGGAWFPLDVTGKTFAAIGHLTPTAWAMDGFQNIVMRGLGLSGVAAGRLLFTPIAGWSAPVLVLDLVALGAFLLVWRRLRQQDLTG